MDSLTVFEIRFSALEGFFGSESPILIGLTLSANMRT